METQQSPWCVKNIEEFLYFVCPECEMKDQCKELFVKHALDQHPNAREYLVHVEMKSETYIDPDIPHEEMNRDLCIKIWKLFSYNFFDVLNIEFLLGITFFIPKICFSMKIC